MSHIPAAVHQHLSSVACHADSGGLLLAASSLTNRYWNGSLWYFADPDMAPNVECCQAGLEIQSGVADTAWISDRKLVAVTDSGSLMLLRMSEDWSTFTLCSQAVEHDDVVSCVSIQNGELSAVTGSYDKQVKVWDLEDCCSTFTCKGHTDIVLDVDSNPIATHMFSSCAQDGCVLIWDTRKEKPARLLNHGATPTCVKWVPDKDSLVAIGEESGCISIIDIRTNRVCASSTKGPHTRAIHSMTFSPSGSQWLASGSDDGTIAVTDVHDGNTLETIWKNRSHTDFVRGLSWAASGEHLYSCGWDQAVCSSAVSANKARNGALDEDELMIMSPDIVV